ncbi:MAG: hypothetical protein HY820_44320 [Acidobacteria bacterium]|nr:hypothetical protein [Acidobacteriota bacterium]
MSKRIVPVLLLSILGGCGGGPEGLTGDIVKYHLEKKPMKLEAEQVTLTPKQFECGLKEELWEQASEKFGERTIARLTAQARALKFDDEVTVSEPGFKLSYVQVRGELPVKMTEYISANERTKDVWDATAKLGVVIQHACFDKPLPLMGVRKGKFSQDAQPVFQFQKHGEDWKATQLVH